MVSKWPGHGWRGETSTLKTCITVKYLSFWFSEVTLYLISVVSSSTLFYCSILKFWDCLKETFIQRINKKEEWLKSQHGVGAFRHRRWLMLLFQLQLLLAAAFKEQQGRSVSGRARHSPQCLLKLRARGGSHLLLTWSPPPSMCFGCWFIVPWCCPFGFPWGTQMRGQVFFFKSN